MPLGVVMRRTFLTPPLFALVMLGRIARQVASGCSKKANSVNNTFALKPRTVSGLPGTAMTRLPCGKGMGAEVSRLSPEDSRAISSSLYASLKDSAQFFHFCNDSSDCRSDGAAMSQV